MVSTGSTEGGSWVAGQVVSTWGRRVPFAGSDLPVPLPGSVLPNFEVKITPRKPYILVTSNHLGEIQVDIEAR